MSSHPTDHPRVAWALTPSVLAARSCACSTARTAAIKATAAFFASSSQSSCSLHAGQRSPTPTPDRLAVSFQCRQPSHALLTRPCGLWTLLPPPHSQRQPGGSRRRALLQGCSSPWSSEYKKHGKCRGKRESGEGGQRHLRRVRCMQMLHTGAVENNLPHQDAEAANHRFGGRRGRGGEVDRKFSGQSEKAPHPLLQRAAKGGPGNARSPPVADQDLNVGQQMLLLQAHVQLRDTGTQLGKDTVSFRCQLSMGLRCKSPPVPPLRESGATNTCCQQGLPRVNQLQTLEDCKGPVDGQLEKRRKGSMRIQQVQW